MRLICKNISIRFRFRGLQVVIILLVILTQIAAHSLWIKQRNNYENIIGDVGALQEPGKILYFYNRASINFQEAQMFFNEFMSKRNDSIYDLYKESINKMALNLDSLDQISRDNVNFKELMEDRKDSEVQIVYLKLALDSLLSQEVSTRARFSIRDISFPEIDNQKVLSSISYDTIRTVEEPERRGLFGRLGAAISGDQDVRKEEIKITVTMNYDNQLIVGSFEDQIAHVLNSSEERFKEQISNIRQTYRRFRSIDGRLLEINQGILKLANQLFGEYNLLFSEVQERHRSSLGYKLEMFRSEQEKLNNVLFIVFLLASLVLILFLVRNFRYEKALERANKTISDNLLAKDKLISLISHDIRTPLNLISIYSGQLKKKYKDLDKVEKFELLQYTANNSLMLSNQILQLATSDNAQVKPNDVNTNLKDLLGPIFKTLRTLTEESGNTLEIDCQVPVDAYVKIDSSNLFRLYYNLVGNANSYTRKGTIKVKIGLAETDSGYSLDSIVEDNGIGIEEKFVDKLFDPYSQVERKGQYNHFGVGLGLFLCKEIVKLYNGTVNIKSKLGEGTIVCFKLQLEKINR